MTDLLQFKTTREEQLTNHLLTLPRILDAEGNPLPKPDTAEELFWMMQEACIWLCKELDRLENKLTK